MKCPACNSNLQKENVNGIEVDICKGNCGGIWFDNFEFRKFDEPHEHAGDTLLNIDKDDSITVDKSVRRKCVKCESIVMMQHFFSVKKEVEVDECPSCGSVWLDGGELEHIRSLFTSEEERRAAANDLFDKMFDPAIEKHFTKQAEEFKRMKNMFKYITPSYYLKK